jgi:hypothetical protein
MQRDISPRIQRLFWDMSVHKLDTNTHKKTIIERVLNNGNLSDWKWLLSTYGSKNIKEALARKCFFGRDNIRPQSRHLASLLVK